MKRHWLILTVFVVGCILLFQVGCQKQVGQPPEPPTVSVQPEPVPEPVPEPTKERPRITFEKVVHDFGEVGPGAKNVCEFKFTNTGDGLLKIEKVGTCCGIRGSLDKKGKAYMPGESGTVTIRYNAGKLPGSIKKQISVYSNDKARHIVKLTIKAKTVVKVVHEPKELKLLLNHDNAGCPEIKLTGLDNRPFAIKRFKATTRGITADYDSSIKAKSHIIQPKVDINKLRKRSRGHIEITLTHPKCRTVIIPFEVLPEFKIDPPSIVLFNTKPKKSIKKVVWLLNNYGEDFEVESVSSKKGIIKVLSQEKVDNRYKFELEITPPADTGKKRFTDVFYMNIKGGEKLRVYCSGFYSRNTKSR